METMKAIISLKVTRSPCFWRYLNTSLYVYNRCPIPEISGTEVSFSAIISGAYFVRSLENSMIVTDPSASLSISSNSSAALWGATSTP